jgi:hypothetical protein
MEQYERFFEQLRQYTVYTPYSNMKIPLVVKKKDSDIIIGDTYITILSGISEIDVLQEENLNAIVQPNPE